MKINHKWLSEYFSKEIPKAEELSNLLSDHAFEVEHVENLSSGDAILDIDILPNRASDCLSHRGVAKEVATLTGLELKERLIEKIPFRSDAPKIDVRNSNKCLRYVACSISGIEIGESKEDIKNKLVSLGQRPINNIVDFLNFVMLDMGQPMHAFDLDKIEGDIVVREAEEGERMTTLDNKDVTLVSGDLVIADSKDILAIAGVKGGKKAEVDQNTKNVILESANFNSTAVRLTSRRLNIITDASKRFENGVAPELAEKGMLQALDFILKNISTQDLLVSHLSDVYARVRKPYRLGVSVSEVNRLLGTSISKQEVSEIISRLGFSYQVVNPRESVLESAILHVGVPYKYGASVTYDAPNYFDCSSFSAYLFSNAGIAIPRMTVDQFVFSKPVEMDELMPGDLIFSQNTHDDEEVSFEKIQEGQTLSPDKNFVTHIGTHLETKEFMPGTKVTTGIDHLGIYMGDGKVIHASGFWYKGQVVLEDLSASPAFAHIKGYGRIMDGEERFVITVPDERLDLRIKEDLIEEIGRVYGLNNMEPVVPNIPKKPKINKILAIKESLKDTLSDMGFDEVMTYSFSKEGEFLLQNPMSKDKPFLRSTLLSGLAESVELNFKNIEILGLDKLMIFEIGKTFSNNTETLNAGFAVASKKKGIKSEMQKIVDATLTSLQDKFGKIDYEVKDTENAIYAELYNIDKLVGSFIDEAYNWKSLKIISSYDRISNHPVILRDIAVWLPKEEDSEALLSIINKNSGELLKRADLFDSFQKGDRVSYAYHLVFQSNERTLTDVEINEIMQRISEDIVKKNFEIR